MDQPGIRFTAIFMQTGTDYVGFIEELPGINAAGRTLEEARSRLRELAAVVFDEERRAAREMLGAREVLREPLILPAQRGRGRRT